MEKFIQNKPLAEQEIGRQLLRETAAYAESSLCRRLLLLHYFGERYEEENCGNCDNCLNPKKKVEAKDDLCAVLETVSAVKEKFKSEHIIDILKGKSTADVKSYKHDELEVFGCEEAQDEKILGAIIRQAMIAGYLERDIENYGLLKITDKGRAFLKKPVSFKIVADKEYASSDELDLVKSAGGCAADPELFAMLKDLRKKLAKKHDLPPYVIFQDPSLEAMATTYPITLEELAGIPGVGTSKAKRYGSDFIKLISRHVEENEIERPEDLVVRAVPSKSNIKIAIIHAIDRKIPLEEIAKSKMMEFDELLDEIEAIVNSGTKINLNYYIDDILDEEQQTDICDYFRESESGDLSDAYKEFGDEFREEDIRLMRIKFMSDMGC